MANNVMIIHNNKHNNNNIHNNKYCHGNTRETTYLHVGNVPSGFITLHYINITVESSNVFRADSPLEKGPDSSTLK